MPTVDRRDAVKLLGLGALGVLAGDLAALARRRGDPAEGAAPATTASTTPSEASGVPPADPPVPGATDTSRPATTPRPSRSAPAPSAPATTRRAATPVALTVVCRSDWRAAPPSGDYRRHQPRVLTIHHTGVVARDDAGAARVRSHQQHHLDAGFVDLAYHFIVGRDGTVFEGRPVAAAGETFTDYDPAGHFLPCLEGDFGRQQPTDAQLDALVGLLAWASATYRIATATIGGHRRYAATACPGDALQAFIDDGSLGRAVDAALAGGGVRLDPTCS